MMYHDAITGCMLRVWQKSKGCWCTGVNVYVTERDPKTTLGGLRITASVPGSTAATAALVTQDSVWTNPDMTVCRCTGLRDTNGVLIYEYDIVAIGDNVHLVWFENGKFRLHMPGYEELTDMPDTSMLVVTGNVFEHPSALPEQLQRTRIKSDN